ncbi:MAG TPA: beta-ketoacyl-[acyl-carrier-protein] synthase II [Deltaproteobacteria bacterium]|nr:beta-ketoacyl-[acyl-carrier-protein] synthase II [Deltaproteobacteria bacterium]
MHEASPVPGEPRRVVVTGLGCITPCGADVASTWASMVAGRSGIDRITRFDASTYSSRIAGEIRGFDAEALLGRRAVRRLGLFMQYALVAADEAMADAGFDVAARIAGRSAEPWPDPDRIGVYIGSGIGGFPEIVDQAAGLQDRGIRDVSPLFIPRSLINLAAGQVAIRYDARGPSLCLATACAVGNHAIGEAWRAIRGGDADVIIAGGTEASLTPLGYGGFMNMRALSRRNDEPQRASRPFDRDRDGFVMSEGAGVVVLEALPHARARAARVYCELRGYAATTDAHHITAPAPGGRGAARCIELALRRAGLAPSEVGYVNAHGTSTPANDVAETQALHKALGDAAGALMVSSTKGVTGHLLGAAGGIEAVATCKALYHGVIPPTANCEHPGEGCDLDYVAGDARQVGIQAAISNGFGFGGTNAVLAFARL